MDLRDKRAIPWEGDLLFAMELTCNASHMPRSIALQLWCWTKCSMSKLAQISTIAQITKPFFYWTTNNNRTTTDYEIGHTIRLITRWSWFFDAWTLLLGKKVRNNATGDRQSIVNKVLLFMLVTVWMRHCLITLVDGLNAGRILLLVAPLKVLKLLNLRIKSCSTNSSKSFVDNKLLNFTL